MWFVGDVCEYLSSCAFLIPITRRRLNSRMFLFLRWKINYPVNTMHPPVAVAVGIGEDDTMTRQHWQLSEPNLYAFVLDYANEIINLAVSPLIKGCTVLPTSSPCTNAADEFLIAAAVLSFRIRCETINHHNYRMNDRYFLMKFII